MDEFLVWLLHRAGLNPDDYRPGTLQRRLPACLRHLRVSSAGAAQAMLEKRPELLPGALNSVLIGVTEFFRDRAVFEKLRQVVLPELLKSRTGVSVCSVGVSEGHELYSVALLLSEAQALNESYLLGLDCRWEAVARAKAGVFTEADLAAIDPGLRQRHFLRRGSGFLVHPEIRLKTHWRVADLYSFNEHRAWDLILFRNVAIYLEPARLAVVWERLSRNLSQGGCLVTGTAERPPRELGLERVVPCIYRKPKG